MVGRAKSGNSRAPSRDNAGNPFVEGISGISIVALTALAAALAAGALAVLISLLY